MHGNFTILRLEDPTKRHIVIVKCDLCTRGVMFDERKVKSPQVRADEIAKAHVCVHPDLTPEQMAEALRELRPSKVAAYKPRLSEAKKGTLRARLYGDTSSTGGNDGRTHGGKR